MVSTYRSFAKINLHLQVEGRRADGFHQLTTLFQSIDLHDLLEVELTSDPIELEVVAGEVPSGANNLAYRAAQLFASRWLKGRGAAMRLHKRIPVGGGLGGGSSNAATVLWALRDLVQAPAEVDALLPVARELGADVPYFLSGGTALGRGRGDVIRPLPDFAERTVWLVVPPVSVSTAEVFAAYARRRQSAAKGALEWAAAADGLDHQDPSFRNDLLPVVLDLYPEVAAVYNALAKAGVARIWLSGSGATLFMYPDGAIERGELLEELPSGCDILTTRSLSRTAYGKLRVVEA